MTPMITPLLLVVAIASQPPSPSKPVLSEQQQRNAARQQSNPKDQNPPTAVVAPTSTGVSQPPAVNPTNDPSSGGNQPSPQDAEWWSATLPDWIVAIFAIVVAVIGGFQWVATQTANKHNALIERGYVVLSHTPPGLRPDGKGGLVVSLSIQNNGNTPADILGGQFAWSATKQVGYLWVEVHEVAKFPPAFIGPKDSLMMLDLPVPIPPEQLGGTVWLTGHIDYRDRFG